MKYTTLFFDADDTLLDFQKCQQNALKSAFEKHGLTFNAAIQEKYAVINQSLWAAFERGEITKPEILAARFRRLFEELRLTDVSLSFEADYQSFLTANGCTIPGARQLCEELSQQLELYILTNGVAATQHGRLQDSGLLPFVKGVFVSEELGCQKPAREYFDAVLERIKEEDRGRILMIGDSLSSDILGGNRAGIPTCWYNPSHKKNQTKARPDYEVADYEQLKKVIFAE